MRPAIDNPTSYEIRAAILIFHDKSMRAGKIHCELVHACEVYGQNIVSEAIERQWCRVYKDNRANRRSG
jgi:hypothetical protein